MSSSHRLSVPPPLAKRFYGSANEDAHESTTEDDKNDSHLSAFYLCQSEHKILFVSLLLVILSLTFLLNVLMLLFVFVQTEWVKASIGLGVVGGFVNIILIGGLGWLLRVE